MARIRAYVALGSNLGDPEATLAAAVRALAEMPGVRLRGVSRLYATTPVGVRDQPEFRNAAVALDVPRGPDAEAGAIALLIDLKRLERAFGRRTGRRWGPRVLDLDLLVFGRGRIRVERPPEGRLIAPVKAASREGRLLEVPHSAARERLFVLAPLADLAPRLVPPGWGETVWRARGRRLATEGAEAVRAVGTWDEETRAWRRANGAADATVGDGIGGPSSSSETRPRARRCRASGPGPARPRR